MSNKRATLRHLNEIVYELFDLFRTYESLATTPSLTELERFFSPTFQLISNGQIVSRSIPEYIEFYSHFRKKVSEVQITEFLEEPIASENRVLIRYNKNVTEKNGHRLQFQIISTFTITQDHIIQWTEEVIPKFQLPQI